MVERELCGQCVDGLDLLPVPGQELVEALGRMLGDASEHVGEPGLRIDVVHLRRDDQGVHEGGSVTAAVGAGEQPSLPAEGDAAQGPLGGIVGQTDPAVFEEPGKAWPSLEHVVHGLGDRRMAGEPRAFLRASRPRDR